MLSRKNGQKSQNENERLKPYQAEMKTNVLNNETNLNNYDEILKSYLMKRKEKYSSDCPICKSKVMPFRLNFQNVIFLCVNQEVK